MRKQPLFLAAALAVVLAVLGCLSSCNDADYITESGADRRVFNLVNDTIGGVLDRITQAEKDVKNMELQHLLIKYNNKSILIYHLVLKLM